MTERRTCAIRNNDPLSNSVLLFHELSPR